VHQEIPALGGIDQDRDRGQPFLKLLLGLGQLLDIFRGVRKGDQRAAAGQRYRIVERAMPSALAMNASCRGGRVRVSHPQGDQIRLRSFSFVLQRWHRSTLASV